MNAERPIDMALRLAKARGWSQTEFGAAIGATPAVISNWKKRGMPADQHAAVAGALGISLDELIGRPTPAPPAAPPPSPGRFDDRHEISATDFGLLQAVHMIMSDEEKASLRKRADHALKVALEQIGGISERK